MSVQWFNYWRCFLEMLFPLAKMSISACLFRDVCMILYQKKNIFLIALEVRVAGQPKVFVNPASYILDQCDYYGYVINSCMADIDDINNINLNKADASNFFIMDYLTKREQNINKKELFEINVNLAKEFEIEDTKNITTNFGNFYCTKKPVSLSEARK